jgi:hypothetical protein
MPTDWAVKVRDAIINLENTTRVLEPNQALALIDDIVSGTFAAGDLATIHGISLPSIRTTLGQVTRTLGTGRGQSLDTGGWYAFSGYERPYEVAPGFAAAWKQARGLA